MFFVLYCLFMVFGWISSVQTTTGEFPCHFARLLLSQSVSQLVCLQIFVLTSCFIVILLLHYAVLTTKPSTKFHYKFVSWNNWRLYWVSRILQNTNKIKFAQYGIESYCFLIYGNIVSVPLASNFGLFPELIESRNEGRNHLEMKSFIQPMAIFLRCSTTMLRVHISSMPRFASQDQFYLKFKSSSRSL